MRPTCDLDDVAQAEWDRIVSVAFWLKPTETGILTLRCMAWSRLMAAEADITKRGHVVKTRNGKVKNPSIQISRDYRTTVMQCDARLGLTTLDRERITTGAETTPADSVDSALCG